ncbi:MAG: toxin-antitoxin system HicB family antitoxin [Clostridiales bacterium]|nr:toxin-antitoxin system HicB family antitoxin [Clostridiales bacterium]
MQYEFKVYQMQIENHLFWVAESCALKGCVGQGDTTNDAIRELADNEKEWLKTARQYDIPIPPVTVKKERQFSGKISLRISPFVHETAYNHSQELGISLNQYLNDAIVSYNTQCQTTYNREPAPTSQPDQTSATLIDLPKHRFTKSLIPSSDPKKM